METVPVILLGAGGVGRSLIEQIVHGRQQLAARNQIHFQITAVVDSKGWLWAADGLSDDQLLEAVAVKKKRQPLSQERPSNLDILAQAEAAGPPPGILVDTTAADGLEPVLDRALAMGWGVALANKKALAGPWEMAQRYYNNPRLRHESTVGGGQPIIATLRYLLDTNDPIQRIQGQLSGSLGFICGRLDEGVPFSRAVAEAKAKGYTEPDPRDDLGGLDARRKIMILGRMAGWPMEEADIEIESLYPRSLAHLTVPEFMAAAVAIDPSRRDRVAAAQAEESILRHTAWLENGKGKVGLTAVPQNSSLANLKYISFRTGFYDIEPLLIGGKGAGVGMTAAGVLGDMIALTREA
jgi:homoserine dehydrogenase